MEQNQEQIGPMTPEQLKVEADFAKNIYEEDNNASPEEIREILESMKLRRPSKAVSLFNKDSKSTQREA